MKQENMLRANVKKAVIGTLATGAVVASVVLLTNPWKKEWGEFVRTHVSQKLLAQSPGDLCPKGKADANFWDALLEATVKLESNFKPYMQYRESFEDDEGNKQISAGLLQLSLDDRKRNTPYCSRFTVMDNVLDPINNLGCGLEIMDRLAGSRPTLRESLGRYWSTIRDHKIDDYLRKKIPSCF